MDQLVELEKHSLVLITVDNGPHQIHLILDISAYLSLMLLLRHALWPFNTLHLLKKVLLMLNQSLSLPGVEYGSSFSLLPLMLFGSSSLFFESSLYILLLLMPSLLFGQCLFNFSFHPNASLLKLVGKLVLLEGILDVGGEDS